MGSTEKERVPALATVKRKSTKRPAVKPKARRRIRSAAPPKKRKVTRDSKKGKGTKRKTVTKHKTTTYSKRVTTKRKKKASKVSLVKKSLSKKAKPKKVSPKPAKRAGRKSKVRKESRKKVSKDSRSRVSKVKRTRVSKKPSKRTKKHAKPTKVAVKKRSPRKTHVEAFEARKAKFLAQIKEAKARPELKLVEPWEPPESAEPTKVPIYKVEAGDARGFTETGGFEKFMHSSHANRHHPEEVVKDVFESAFIHNLKKGPFEADEVNIFRYGVIIRPRNGIATDKLTDKIGEIMVQYPGSSIHVVNEGTTFSIRLNFGDKRSPELAGNVSADLQNNSGIIGDIYSLLEDSFGATDWFAFWETDDAMYE